MWLTLIVLANALDFITVTLDFVTVTPLEIHFKFLYTHQPRS